ncbi:MAG: DUF5906 domain-containing protein [Patescibacteria group bacterium]|nr:DUF5906 domain-containing protein [Patescibacteria group bacterium]
MLKINAADVRENKKNNIYIAKSLISTMNNLVKNKKDNSIYEYNGKFYELLEKQDLKDKLFIFLEKYHITERWSASIINSIISAIQSCSQIKKVELDNYNNLIAIKNGLFNIATQEIIPYSKNIYITSIIENLEYKKPEKWDLPTILNSAPFFQEYILSTFNNEENTIENIAMMIGCLLSTSIKSNKFFILNGPSAAGKSPLIKLISSFFTTNQKTSLSLKQISTRSGFEREGLLNSRINIIGDEEKSFLTSGEFKKITSQENITIQRKGKTAIDFQPKFKIIAATNHLPAFDDTSDGIANRLLIIDFKNIFKNQADLDKMKNPSSKSYYLAKKNIEKNILKKEMSTVLNFGIWGLKKFNEENKEKNKGKYEFIFDENFRQAIENYKKNASTFYEFLIDTFEYVEDLDEDKWLSTEDIKEYHNEWHSKNVQNKFPPKISTIKMGLNIKTIFKCQQKILYKKIYRNVLNEEKEFKRQFTCYPLRIKEEEIKKTISFN